LTLFFQNILYVASQARPAFELASERKKLDKCQHEKSAKGSREIERQSGRHSGDPELEVFTNHPSKPKHKKACDSGKKIESGAIFYHSMSDRQRSGLN
jgi:hypothetical protein